MRDLFELRSSAEWLILAVTSVVIVAIAAVVLSS